MFSLNAVVATTHFRLQSLRRLPNSSREVTDVYDTKPVFRGLFSDFGWRKGADTAIQQPPPSLLRNLKLKLH